MAKSDDEGVRREAERLQKEAERRAARERRADQDAWRGQNKP